MPTSAKSEIQRESLSNEETFDYIDLSTQENEYAEALKKLQLATQKCLSFSSAPLGGVQKNVFVNSRAIDLIESEIKLMITTFDDMADNVTNMPPSEITSTTLSLSAQSASPLKNGSEEQNTSEDVDQTLVGTASENIVTQIPGSQLTDNSKIDLLKEIKFRQQLKHKHQCIIKGKSILSHQTMMQRSSKRVD